MTETFPLPEKFLLEDNMKLEHSKLKQLESNPKQSVVSIGDRSKSRDQLPKRSSLSRDSKLDRRSNKNSVLEKCKHQNEKSKSSTKPKSSGQTLNNQMNAKAGID